MSLDTFVSRFAVKPGSKIDLTKDFDADDTGGLKKSEVGARLQESLDALCELQDRLYAEDTHGLLIILQAMDAAGKDGVIKHVMSGVNPQGCQVYSFKAPSVLELNHDYLWRNFITLPERGRIGIFNRSYYEEVLVVRVHPEILAAQRLPRDLKDGDIWRRRYSEINNFEKYLTNNGFQVVKLFLNVSKEEQRKRFMDRIDRPDKNWKFSADDVRERSFWDQYMKAYGEMLSSTSTECAPWYIVPADAKWFTRIAAGSIILKRLQDIHPEYPQVDDEQRREIKEAKRLLEQEG